jgi:integrase
MSAGSVYRPRVRRAFDPSHDHFPSCGPKGCYFEVATYWLKYYARGVCHREPTHSTSKRDAQRMLREKMAERETGRVIGRPDRVSFADLRKGVERHYAREGNSSLTRAKLALQHLEDFLKADTLALDITATRVEDYIEHRLAAGRARATVRYEIALLNLAFSVAVKSGILAVRPVFPSIAVRNARSGFFSTADLAALLLELPDYLRPVVHFARLTGWRKDEILGLTWEHIDWEGKVIRLAADETKGHAARTFPFTLAPAIETLLTEQWAARKGPFVFHDNGRVLRTFYKAWDAACTRADLPGRLFHDLRRTAARDLRRAGVDEGTIMKLCGWKTRAMFDRYNIIDEADLAAAVAKRFPQAMKEEQNA